MRICQHLAMVASLQFGLSGPWDCHVYAIPTPEGAVLVDVGSGTATAALLANLHCAFGSDAVAAVLLTHTHYDHAGGACEIRRHTGCQIIAPEPCRVTIESADEDASGLRNARQQGVYPPELRLSPCAVDRAVGDGERFCIAGLEFTAIHVRGHSRDAHCFLTDVEGSRWLFTGDVVFYGGILGLVNSNGSEMAGYRADLHKLDDLGVVGLFPGHGLFTVCGGQRHLQCAIQQVQRGFIPRQIGQGDLIF